ncbi:hypothetical protein IGI04_030764 [Brassica rapa subsp. trilocularis]|uniref:Uncharacterized protein n=1 Tax=Brassica rapa subsp. trilocularis TaxID=1813537 RepID=A0ABQ7LRN5_BRACM|nr:hypothetical protein IGI04_030764 [Brassica rapa subsp. trilocularis]
MSVCELKEHHTDATETVNNLCNKLRQRHLQLLNTDGLCFSSSSSQSICSGLGFGQVLGGADWYLLTPTLIWKVSKPSLVRQIHLSVWFLSAGASQNNRSRKIKELDKKAKSSTKKKNKKLGIE